MEIRFGAVLLLVKILFCFMLDDTGNFGLNLHISLPGTYTVYAKASFFLRGLLQLRTVDS